MTLLEWMFHLMEVGMAVNRGLKIDVYGKSLTANGKLQIVF